MLSYIINAMDALILIPILTGLGAGTVVNYLADVLPVTRTLSRPSCPNCGQAYDTADYLFMKACNQCGNRRRARAWSALVIMVAVHLYIWINPPARLPFLLSVLLTIYLATVFVIDLEHRLILHPTSIFGSLLGLGVGWLNYGPGPTLLGGFAGFLIMLVFYLFGMLFTRIRARRLQRAGQAADDEEALGAGDVILAAIIGLMLGWPLIGLGLLTGILLGGAISLLLVVWLALTSRYKQNALMIFVPYGPYFIVSTFLILYFPAVFARLVPG
jgi:leader peptidase (prepilin peptidase)/N-methyltransferase